MVRTRVLDAIRGLLSAALALLDHAVEADSDSEFGLVEIERDVEEPGIPDEGALLHNPS